MLQLPALCASKSEALAVPERVLTQEAAFEGRVPQVRHLYIDNDW